MSNEVIEISKAETLQAINKAEIDIQIATAKQYPRNLTEVLNKIATYATMDQETAEDCFYVLKRKDSNGNDSVIEGLSVRMAEIIASAWGNIRVQTMIVANDGKMITARAMCHDLESNVAVAKDVSRSIVTKKGFTYSQDMQIVTGNAASAIAFRNAVLAVIPKAVTKKIINEVKEVAMGQSLNLEQSRANAVQNFKNMGVTEEQLFFYLGVSSAEEIDKQKIFELRATKNAIKEGTTTVHETFVQPLLDYKSQELANKKAETTIDKAAVAMAQAIGKGESVDPETGEMKTAKAKKTSK